MTEQQHKQPLITLKSFLISFVIILAVLLVVSSFTNKDSDDERSVSSSESTYEYTVVDGEEGTDSSVLIIPVQGVILTESSGGLGFFDFLGEEGVTYGYDVKNQLERASEDDSIKAVLIEINSPGGTVGGAKAISDGIEAYKQTTGNPVYAHITDIGASGAYWAAVSTDSIVSEVGSMVGSIGVIMGPFTYYDGVISETSLLSGVETENGIEYRYFTAGQYKDTGSPYRPLTPEEITHWQTGINNEYDLFVNHVSTHRNMSPEFIRNTVKAFPYENKRALELSLIDEVGSKEETIKALAQKAGLSEDSYNVIREEQITDFFTGLFSGVHMLQSKTTPAKQIGCTWCNSPMFLYDSSYTILR